MATFVSKIKKKYNEEELFDIAQTLNKSYDLFMFDEQVWNLLEAVLEKISNSLLSHYKKNVIGHKVVNNLIYNYYPGEMPVKYSFIKKLINNNNEVSLFEMYVDSSRIDIARINGNSYAYEIKTDLDKLNKLKKQVLDYSKAFEYVYVITTDNYLSKVKEIIPDYCGIYIYHKDKGVFTFNKVKEAVISPEIDPVVQIDCFSSSDLQNILLKKGYKRKHIPNRKAQRKELIMSKFNEDEINNIFKVGVKMKYEERWGYVKDNFDKILPIDVQAFFKSKADPGIVYYKSSLSE